MLKNFLPFRKHRARRVDCDYPKATWAFGRYCRGFRFPILLTLALAMLLLAGAAGCTPNLGASTRGWGAIAADLGVVYATTLSGQVLALDDFGSDGVSVRWLSTVGGEEGFGGAYGSPTIGRYLYVSAIDGHIYALNPPATAGAVETAWRNPPVVSEDDVVPLVGSAALDEAGGIIAVGSEDGGLYAFDAITGAALPWSPYRTDREIWSTPVLHNGVVYFGSQNGAVYAVSLATGELLWQFQTGGAVVAKPLIHGNMLIVGSFDRQLYALSLQSGALAWQFEAGNWWWATPVASERVIWAPAMDGKVYALDQNGQLLWEHDMGSPVVASPVLLERGLVVASVDGKLSVLRASGTDHGPSREIASLTVGEAEIKAPLAVVKNAVGLPSTPTDSVYIGSDDGTVRRVQVVSGINILWCFDTTERALCN